MEPEACYVGTLQLKQLAEYRLAQCQASSDQAAEWSATVAYFEDQLHQRRNKARLNLHQLFGLIHLAFTHPWVK